MLDFNYSIMQDDVDGNRVVISQHCGLTIKSKNVVYNITTFEGDFEYGHFGIKLEKWIINTIQYERDRDLALNTIGNRNIKNTILDYCYTKRLSFREFVEALEDRRYNWGYYATENDNYDYVKALEGMLNKWVFTNTNKWMNVFSNMKYAFENIKIYDSDIIKIKSDTLTYAIDLDKEVFIVSSIHCPPIVRTFDQLLEKNEFYVYED
jgi:hypothetical protein